MNTPGPIVAGVASYAPSMETALRERFRGKGARYLAISVFSTAITQVLIFLFVDGFGWHGAVANVAAVCISSVPSYLLNRRWVWRKVGAHSLSREVAPFWLMNLLGLALSTIFAAIAYHIWGTGLAVSLANMAGFGVLWIAKFLVLDTYLFRQDSAARV
jgi:putative flippase GtrA